MADSAIPLTKWFALMWLMLARPMITTAELVSTLGIARIMTVRSMADRVRAVMPSENASDLLAGVDTCFATVQATSPESSARKSAGFSADDNGSSMDGCAGTSLLNTEN
jgi:hypothetical protein